MELSDQEYYRALLAQDTRFDGRFYVCVSSTGIYCRPICPAPAAKLKNCSFVKTAAAAEDAGYRPCLRCRPETAPGSAARLGTGATVKRALRLISETAADGVSLEALANRLGVSSRHLRRLFHDQLGAGPKSIVQTERFAIARQLLVETNLPIGQVAFASGFGSIRRFNDATRKAFGVTPGVFRSQRKRSPVQHPGARLLLGYRPPYAWEQMLAFLRTRAVSRLEQVSDDGYRRTVSIDGAVGILSVGHQAEKNRLVVEFQMDRPIVLAEAIQRVKDIFDLNAAPGDISEHLSADVALAPLFDRSPGLRIPGAWDIYELAVRAIIGQQISVRGATTMLGRFVEAFGKPLANSTSSGATSGDGTDPDMVFPVPPDVCGGDLQKIGLTQARSKTLMTLTEAFAADPGFIHPAMDIDVACGQLLELRGIGLWTAEYIALRALRNPDAFPAADVALLKASGAANAAILADRAEAWRPWRGYAALHLWNSLNTTQN